MTRGERRTKYIYGGRENFGKIFLPQWLWGEISVLFISSWNACRPEIERVLVNNAINIANIGVCCSRWWNWVEGRSVDFLSIAPFCRLPPIIINRFLQRISWILMKHRNPLFYLIIKFIIKLFIFLINIDFPWNLWRKARTIFTKFCLFSSRENYTCKRF